MKGRTSLCFLLLLSLFSCVDQETGDYQLEYRMNLELPADANPLFTHIFERDIPSNWRDFLAANNLKDADIRMVRARSVVMTPLLVNPIGYGIFSEAHVSVYDPNDPNGILPVGDLYDLKPDLDELVFLPGLADVKPIISQPEFRMKLALNLRSIPGSVSEHSVVLRLDVFLN